MNRFIYFSTRNEFFRIRLSQIMFFVADKNYTILQLSSGKRLIFTFSLQKMQEYLSEKLNEDAKHFARVGKSHIINLNYIHQIDTAKQLLILLSLGNDKEFSITLSKEALRKLRLIFISN